MKRKPKEINIFITLLLLMAAFSLPAQAKPPAQGPAPQNETLIQALKQASNGEGASQNLGKHRGARGVSPRIPPGLSQFPKIWDAPPSRHLTLLLQLPIMPHKSIVLIGFAPNFGKTGGSPAELGESPLPKVS